MLDDNENGMAATVLWTAVGIIAVIVVVVVAAILFGYLPVPFA